MNKYLVYTDDEPVGYYYAENIDSAIDMCLNHANWNNVSIKRSELTAVIAN